MNVHPEDQRSRTMPLEELVELSEAHAADAETNLDEITDHLSKRGRKFGTDQAHLAQWANAHATLAIFYQREAHRREGTER